MFENAKAYNGVPGSGKSTMIGKQAIKGDIVLAKTSIATQNLKKRVAYGVKVMTIEKSQTITPSAH